MVDEKKSSFSDGSVWAEVTLGLRLFGEDGLIKPRRRPGSAAGSRDHPGTSAPSPSNRPPAVQDTTDRVYTGLIIDAGGLDASPAMLPKILSQNGGVIYGTRELDREYVIRTGVMGYQSDLQKALKMERVGSNPLVVKAAAVGGKNKTDFIVTDQDAQKIVAAAALKNFLKECRVVAVLK